MIKISITLFNRRLTGLTSQKWMMAHYIFLFLLVCYIVITLFLEMFKCHPAASHYSLIKIGKVENSVQCLHFSIIGISLSAVHVAFDFALLSVPLIILYKIKNGPGEEDPVGYPLLRRVGLLHRERDAAPCPTSSRVAA